MIPVYVLTNDKHLFLLPGFTTCFNRFWPGQEVTIFGYSAPDRALPENFCFQSIAPENYPAERWSDGLLEVLNRTEDDHFVLLLEDYWLYEAVDVAAVNAAFRFMARCARQGVDVLRVDLSGDRARLAVREPYRIAWEGRELVESRHDSPYQMSFQAAVWNRDALQRTLVRGENPWQSEVFGTERLRQMGDRGPRVFGLEQTALCYQPVFRTKRHTLRLEGLPADVLAEIGDDILGRR